MRKSLIYRISILTVLSNISCTHASEDLTKTDLTGTGQAVLVKTNNQKINIYNSDMFEYINSNLGNSLFASPSWSILDERGVSVDSLTATLVNEHSDPKFLVYTVTYPVFKLAIASPSNGAYKKWYSSQLAQDSADTPTLHTWLRLGWGKHFYEHARQGEYYTIAPLKSSIYTTPAGAVFISSSATYTFGGGLSGNLSGLVTHLVRVATPTRDFAQEFDDNVRRRGWPELTNMIQQHSGVTFEQLSDSSAISRQFFLANKGLIVGFESSTDSQTNFLVEIPYQVFNERFK